MIIFQIREEKVLNEIGDTKPLEKETHTKNRKEAKQTLNTLHALDAVEHDVHHAHVYAWVIIKNLLISPNRSANNYNKSQRPTNWYQLKCFARHFGYWTH